MESKFGALNGLIHPKSRVGMSIFLFLAKLLFCFLCLGHGLVHRNI